MIFPDRRNPILYGYLKRYQEDPKSRVFAPLAEAYRKAGLVDEAIQIAREGVRVHPGFFGGRVALARALFDKKNYQEVLAELKDVVQNAPDNLAAQRLTAESHLLLGNLEDALRSYKMLLFYSPLDKDTAALVHELESESYQKGVTKLEKSPEPEFVVKKAVRAIGEDPEIVMSRWVKRVELLQNWLQRIEKYRATSHVPGPAMR